MLNQLIVSRLVLTFVVAVLPCVLNGCGATADTGNRPGGGLAMRKSTYKPQDAQLVSASNNIPAYSTPDNARKVMKRAPDETVQGEDGSVTHIYRNGDQPDAEKLRLKYAGNHLIGKQIMPSDSSMGTGNGVVNKDGYQDYKIRGYETAAPKYDGKSYTNLKEYDPKNNSVTKPGSYDYGSINASVPAPSYDANPNAAFNDRFNQQLNVKR